MRSFFAFSSCSRRARSSGATPADANLRQRAARGRRAGTRGPAPLSISSCCFLISCSLRCTLSSCDSPSTVLPATSLPARPHAVIQTVEPPASSARPSARTVRRVLVLHVHAGRLQREAGRETVGCDRYTARNLYFSRDVALARWRTTSSRRSAVGLLARSAKLGGDPMERCVAGVARAAHWA